MPGFAISVDLRREELQEEPEGQDDADDHRQIVVEGLLQVEILCGGTADQCLGGSEKEVVPDTSVIICTWSLWESASTVSSIPSGWPKGRRRTPAWSSDLLTGLRERGLDTTRPIFVGLDGGKALRAAVVRVFDHPVIGRCQLHKLRNVADKLPGHLASTVTKRMRAAYRAESALIAQAQLQALAKELERTHPGAVGSLREGMVETLTVLRLNVPPTLSRTLRSTNSIESMIFMHTTTPRT